MQLSRLGAFLALIVISSGARDARADVDDYQGNYIPEPAVRRSDITIGTHIGASFGGVTGYPNEVEKVDNPEFEASTGFGGGPGGSIWLGAALRDWFTFGVGVNHTEVTANSLSSAATTFMVHIEGFPLFYRGRLLRDLGVFAEFGAGGRNIVRDGDTVGEGGAMSFVGAGAFWEPLRLGSHLSFGPMAEVTHMFSQSLTSTVGLVGLRAVYYGGP